MNRQELKKVLMLLGISDNEWEQTRPEAMKLTFGAKIRAGLLANHPDKNPSAPLENIQLINDFNSLIKKNNQILRNLIREYSSTSGSFSEPDLTRHFPETPDIHRSRTDPNFQQQPQDATNSESHDTPPSNTNPDFSEKPLTTEQFINILDGKQWRAFKRELYHTDETYKANIVLGALINRINKKDYYDFVSIIADRSYLPNNSTDLILLQLILVETERLINTPSKASFALLSKLQALLDTCSSYDDEISGRPLREIIGRISMQSLMISQKRKQNLLMVYKAIYQALLEGEGLIHTTAKVWSTVSGVAKEAYLISCSFFSQPEAQIHSATIPAQGQYPWENKSDDEFYSAIMRCNENPETSLLEKKTAILSIGFVDGYINESLLLTMIYIDKCPIKNYLGIKPDTLLTPCNEDGGYHLVNAYISQHVIRFTETKHAPFHKRGELHFKNPQFHEQYYGQYKNENVLLNINHPFAPLSLPGRIKSKIKDCCPVWGEILTPAHNNRPTL